MVGKFNCGFERTAFWFAEKRRNALFKTKTELPLPSLSLKGNEKQEKQTPAQTNRAVDYR
jgi:hypothetical protein